MTTNYLVMGAGRSGIAATKLLLRHNQEVTLFDDQKLEELSYFRNSDLAHNKNLITYFGQENPLSLTNYQALILSPGISFEHALVKKAQNLGLNIMSEIDCAYDFLPQLKIIGITGTNGKSTTTIMIENILRCAQKKAYAGGNLGIPLSELALKTEKEPLDYLVVELSSFQLENIKKLKLDAAILLNITPDHLDRYNNLEEYQQAKIRIFDLLKPESIGIINENLRALKINNNLGLRFFSQKDLNLINRLNIRGTHNQENALAAYLTTDYLGINQEHIFSGLSSYTPLPHRCELVGLKNNISYINDSKGTTVVAVTKALSLVSGPVHLLLGGLAKGEDFSALAPNYFPNIAGYYVFGQAKPEIIKALNTPKAYAYINLKEAFRAAQEEAKAGHSVLLSPGCASYDQFKDYTERGQLFRSLVESI